MDATFADRHMTYYERPNIYVNYNWSTGSFGAFDILRQVKKMDELATGPALTITRALQNFSALIISSIMTETFGDIPYSDALKAIEGNVKPKYDAQKDVYLGVLNELEEANNCLTRRTEHSGRRDLWWKCYKMEKTGQCVSSPCAHPSF